MEYIKRRCEHYNRMLDSYCGEMGYEDWNDGIEEFEARFNTKLVTFID